VLDFKRNAWDQQAQSKRTVDPSSQEIAKNFDEQYTSLENDFLTRVPPEKRAQVQESLTAYRNQMHMDGLDFQYTSNDAFVKEDVKKKGDLIGNDIAKDPTPDSLARRRDEFFTGVIDPAPITPLEKQALKDYYTTEFAKISGEELQYRK